MSKIKGYKPSVELIAPEFALATSFEELIEKLIKRKKKLMPGKTTLLFRRILRYLLCKNVSDGFTWSCVISLLFTALLQFVIFLLLVMLKEGYTRQHRVATLIDSLAIGLLFVLSALGWAAYLTRNHSTPSVQIEDRQILKEFLEEHINAPKNASFEKLDAQEHLIKGLLDKQIELIEKFKGNPMFEVAYHQGLKNQKDLEDILAELTKQRELISRMSAVMNAKVANILGLYDNEQLIKEQEQLSMQTARVLKQTNEQGQLLRMNLKDCFKAFNVFLEGLTRYQEALQAGKLELLPENIQSGKEILTVLEKDIHANGRTLTFTKTPPVRAGFFCFAGLFAIFDYSKFVKSKSELKALVEQIAPMLEKETELKTLVEKSGLHIEDSRLSFPLIWHSVFGITSILCGFLGLMLLVIFITRKHIQPNSDDERSLQSILVIISVLLFIMSTVFLVVMVLNHEWNKEERKKLEAFVEVSLTKYSYYLDALSDEEKQQVIRGIVNYSLPSIIEYNGLGFYP